MSVSVGIGLGMLHPSRFEEVAIAADRSGFESIWLPEHLVFPTEMSGSPHLGSEHPPVPPETPLFDVFAYLSYLAAHTRFVRLGTWVYLLGLRHPFVAARAITTLDQVSKGRAEVGVGAGWLRQEWTATGLDPRSRGRRLDECLALCRRLFTESRIEHRGRFFDFDEVRFEPKPIQTPHPPFHGGGESAAALDRAARTCEGWIGVDHTPESAARAVAVLHERLRVHGREAEGFQVTVGGDVENERTLREFEAAGVTRVITSPWRRSRDAAEGVSELAERLGLDTPESSA